MARWLPRAGNIGEEEEEQIELIPDRELDPATAPAEPSTVPAPPVPAPPVPVPA